MKVYDKIKLPKGVYAPRLIDMGKGTYTFGVMLDKDVKLKRRDFHKLAIRYFKAHGITFEPYRTFIKRNKQDKEQSI